MAASQPSQSSINRTLKQLQEGEAELLSTNTLNGTRDNVRRSWKRAAEQGINLSEFPRVDEFFRTDPKEVKRRESLAEARRASEERAQAIRDGKITTAPGPIAKPKPKESPQQKPEPDSTSPVDHSIDAAEARRFIELLGRIPADVRLRAFPHKNNPDAGRIGPKKGRMNLKNLKPQEEWQEAGRGLYCVINAGGDTKESITSCPACFFELDGLTKAEQNKRIGLIPELKDLIGMTVATREGDDGSLHSYFLLEEPITDVLRWRLMQWRLIQLFKSDPKVEDPSRVMRLPGAWYVLGDGSFHSRSQIVAASGKRLSFAALEKAVGEAEEMRGKSAVDAVPNARWRDQEVVEMLLGLFPEETSKKLAEQQQHSLQNIKNVPLQGVKPWHNHHTLDEIKEALAMMPPRIAERGTYEEDRQVMAGLGTALEEIDLERGHAIELLEEAGWEGWNADQVLSSSYELPSGLFWRHARKCGWKSKQEKEKQAERIRQEVAQTYLVENLKRLIDEGVVGNELIEAQFAISADNHVPLASIQKLTQEVIQNDQAHERMADALNLLTTAQDEEPISVQDLVPEQFYREVIQDFRKGIEADELMILMLVLTTLSSVLPIGTKVRLQDFTNHDQAVLLYFLILTVSGGKKTLLFDELIEKPLMASAVAKRAEQKCIRTKQRQREEKKRRDGKADSETMEVGGEAIQVRDQVPIQPLLHIVSDFTGEGLDRNCQQAEAHYKHGFLIGTDEGRQLLAGDQYKGGGSTYTTDKLTRLYDGKGGNQVRGDSRNERQYKESHVAIAALLQPEIYDQIAAQQSDDESGFWPRFLTVETPPVRIRRATKEERKAAKKKTYPEALQALYDAANLLGSSSHQNKLGDKPHFRFSAEAQDWWYETALDIEEEQARQAQNGDALVARVLGKASGQVGRLSALLHLLNELTWGMDCGGYTPAIEIPLATVQKAFRLQARLMSRTLKQRLRATGDGASNDTKLLQEVQTRCLQRDPDGEGLKLGVIERFWNQRNRPSKEDLYQALSVLAFDGWGEIRKGNSNRRGWIYVALKPLPA